MKGAGRGRFAQRPFRISDSSSTFPPLNCSSHCLTPHFIADPSPLSGLSLGDTSAPRAAFLEDYCVQRAPSLLSQRPVSSRAATQRALSELALTCFTSLFHLASDRQTVVSNPLPISVNKIILGHNHMLTSQTVPGSFHHTWQRAEWSCCAKNHPAQQMNYLQNRNRFTG